MTKKKLLGSFSLILGTMIVTSVSMVLALRFTNNTFWIETKTNNVVVKNLTWFNDTNTTDINQVKEQIDSQFIFNNISKILSGNYDIKDSNDISNVYTSVKDNEIKISFTLASGTWYTGGADKGNYNKIFSFTIKGF